MSKGGRKTKMTSETSPDHQNSEADLGQRGGADTTQRPDWATTLTELLQHAMKHKSVRDQSGDVVHRQAAGLLAKVVEGHVIPRLVLAHQGEATTSPDTHQLVPDDITAFTDLLLGGDATAMDVFVDGLLKRGFAEKNLYLDLLAPAARLLGVYWEEDKCSFTEVTIGLGMLQSLLYRLSARQMPDRGFKGSAPKALFLTPEGAQHSFGVRMAEDLFRQAGWETHCILSASLADVQDRVATTSFDVVGVSLAVQDHFEHVKDLVTHIRLSSQNKKVRVMVGGQLVTNNPELVEQLGVDHVARDGMEAIALARELGYVSRT
jgi:MerR family transcriptional regulator, light-induced transcriptional regulator